MKRLLMLIFVISVFVPFVGVKATTLQDLYDELSSLQNSYSAAQKKANMTQAELNSVKASIVTTEAEIKQAQSDITKAENDIVASEKKIEQKKEETNQMLLYLQLTNTQGNNMLEYVFEADNYTDFIYRYAVVTQMSDYNQGLMDELNALIKELTAKKADLAEKQEELAAKKTELQAKYLIVQAQYKDDQDDSMTVAAQISEQKKLIKSYENVGCKRTDNINNCGIVSVNGWTYPLKHFSQSSIYGENRGSSSHYAVDLAVSEGSSVYAVANGKVIVSRVYWRSGKENVESCGGLVVQIQHSYNGSNYVSLYMHLLSTNVSTGDVVTGGQVIGTSGGGSLEVAKWKDSCTEGAHLHFAMAYGSSTIGSSSLVGSTFNPVKFFPAMKGYGASM